MKKITLFETCPHCGEALTTRSEIRQHLTLKRCKRQIEEDEKIDPRHIPDYGPDKEFEQNGRRILRTSVRS
jgi:hypothetical protein